MFRSFDLWGFQHAPMKKVSGGGTGGYFRKIKNSRILGGPKAPLAPRFRDSLSGTFKGQAHSPSVELAKNQRADFWDFPDFGPGSGNKWTVPRGGTGSLLCVLDPTSIIFMKNKKLPKTYFSKNIFSTIENSKKLKIPKTQQSKNPNPQKSQNPKIPKIKKSKK